MNRTGKHIDLIIIHIEAKLSVKIRLTSIIYQINHALSRSFATLHVPTRVPVRVKLSGPFGLMNHYFIF